MSDITAATTDQVAASTERATTAVFHGIHRVWLAGLGLLVVAGEQAQSALTALEAKGEQLEPSVAAPFRRVGEAASRAMDRAGASVKQVGGAVPALAGPYRRVSEEELKDQVDRLIDDKLAPIVQRLEALEEKIPARRRKDTEERAERSD
jgi:hypothetical protein